MIEFIIVAIVIASIWFFLKFRKKQSDSTTPPSSAKIAQVIKTESKPVEKTVTPIEVTATPVQAATPAVNVENKPIAQTQTIKTAISENTCLPQDSMLRRHYLTNLHAIITSLNPIHPTDSALSRHYETQIAANIEQCLNNEAAMAQLLNAYNACKKTAAPVIAKEPQVEPIKEEVQATIEPVIEKTELVAPVVIASSHKASKIPEDSALKRHYITHLYAQVAATLAPRPTDATLRRHYDALLESEVKKQLAS